jgi:ankyrin repeat protein
MEVASLLETAAVDGHLDVSKALIAAGADLDEVHAGNKTPVITAVANHQSVPAYSLQHVEIIEPTITTRLDLC